MTKITDKNKILVIFRNYLGEHRFIHAIFSREHRKGGINYEGHGILGINTKCPESPEEEISITLTSRDVNYNRPLAILDLSKIEYILML